MSRVVVWTAITVAFTILTVAYTLTHLAGMTIPLLIATTGWVLRNHTITPVFDLDAELRNLLGKS